MEQSLDPAINLLPIGFLCILGIQKIFGTNLGIFKVDSKKSNLLDKFDFFLTQQTEFLSRGVHVTERVYQND